MFNRQRHDKSRTLSRRTGRGDRAAVPLDDLFADSKSHAGSLILAASVQPLKQLENPLAAVYGFTCGKCKQAKTFTELAMAEIKEGLFIGSGAMPQSDGSQQALEVPSLPGGAQSKLRSVYEVADKMRAQGLDTSLAVGSSIEAVTMAAKDDASLEPLAMKDRLVAIMFTDIEGSTAMAAELGDRKWFDLLRSHNDSIREKIAKFGGIEVKSVGDGFMIAFEDLERALSCATAIQRAITASMPQIKVRIGVHAGRAIRWNASRAELGPRQVAGGRRGDRTVERCGGRFQPSPGSNSRTAQILSRGILSGLSDGGSPARAARDV